MSQVGTRISSACVAAIIFAAAARPDARAQGPNSIRAAQAYRKAGQPVNPVTDSTIVCEAEEFQVMRPGWEAKAWGSNYYAATLANSFLSRKAYLGAPEQCERSVAMI